MFFILLDAFNRIHLLQLRIVQFKLCEKLKAWYEKKIQRSKDSCNYINSVSIIRLLFTNSDFRTVDTGIWLIEILEQSV